MPLYEYDCSDCGGFDGWRPMAESTAPAPCPRCGKLGLRVLSATAGRRAQGARRRGIPEPTLQVRREEPPARSAPPRPPHAHGRPWMLGH